jgi:hypothetical protein
VSDLQTALRRLPRFGVVDGVITPHHRGTMVRLDDVLAAATPPAEPLDEERLARALYNTTRILWSSEDDPWAGASAENRADARKGAQQLIAAYRSLPAAPPEP